jgi:prepilin-type N-terminal cleavage/methylation domain-containing protein/prepilin-type processing-associated H-X9-DG protein
MRGRSNLCPPRGFTLVELLVVIGIIALLVSMLLPALNAAKRQAESVKCMSCLREIGNANAMYVNENKGWEVPGWLRSYYTISYTQTSPAVTDFGPQYWYQFLSKYVTRAQMGTASGNNTKTQIEQIQEMTRSVFWGCPAFATYRSTSAANGPIGGVNVTQPGYGFNSFPEYTAAYPKIQAGPNTIGDSGLGGTSTSLDGNAVSIITCVNGTSLTPGAQDWTHLLTGRWYKFGQYTHPVERALVADSQFWSLESMGVDPPGEVIPGQKFYDPVNTWYTPYTGQTTADAYRHGRFPSAETVGSSGHYSPAGGKVACNVLFCDGHVATVNDRPQIYRVTRMRFPG